jgi:hypothetical protein
MPNRPADAEVQSLGSFRLLRPLSPQADEWVEANLILEPWQRFGGALVIDQRCIDEILLGLRLEGLRVEVEC